MDGSEETDNQIYNRAQRDMRYFGEHEQELWEQYGEQWVAIYNEQVVAVHRDYDVLRTELVVKGIPIGHAIKSIPYPKESKP